MQTTLALAVASIDAARGAARGSSCRMEGVRALYCEGLNSQLFPTTAEALAGEDGGGAWCSRFMLAA